LQEWVLLQDLNGAFLSCDVLVVDPVWWKSIVPAKPDQQEKQKTPGASRSNLFPAVPFRFVPPPLKWGQLVNSLWLEAPSVDQQATVCPMSAFNLRLLGETSWIK
jgi:hypothetical protein